jgi:alpha-tubulin suppressor-like RCC1 family protein
MSFRLLQLVAAHGLAAMLGCGQLASVEEKTCQACASVTSRLVCDDKGNVTAQECGAGSYCADGACFSNDIVSIAVSPTHACAAKQDGTIWCWGPPAEVYGELWPLTPRKVDLPPGKRATSSSSGLSVGLVHTCAILADGRSSDSSTGYVYCWGGNNYGQLGTINYGDAGSLGPSTPIPNLPAVRSITSGFGHSCALSADGGNVFCWGANYLGQSAQTQTTRCEVLKTLSGVDGGAKVPQGIAAPGAMVTFGSSSQTQVREIISKGHHTCALAGSTLYCWGSNCGNGHPGDGERADILGIRCTGAAGPTGGQLQMEPTGDGCYQWTPREMIFPPAVGVSRFAVGFAATYAMEWANKGDPARVYAWGANDEGQLGIGTDDPFVSTPTAVQLTVDDAGTTQALIDATDLISSAGSDLCAMRDGEFVCWGINDCGELGWGSYQGKCSTARSSSLPLAAAPRSGGHFLIARGDDYGCAVTPGTTTVSGWGKEGFLGDGQNTSSPVLSNACDSPESFRIEPVPIVLDAR